MCGSTRQKPKVLRTTLPLWNSGKPKKGAPDHRVLIEEHVSIILPSDIFYEIHKRGLQEETLTGLCSLKDWWCAEVDQHYLNCLKETYGQLDFERLYPIMFHEDGVPNFQNESAVIWSFCCPCNGACSWVSRNAIIALPSSRISKQTRSRLVEILEWDMKALGAGKFPQLNHMGEPFVEKFRKERAGQSIMKGGFKAVFSYWKGDMEQHYLAHDLRRYYKANEICDWCRAMSNCPGLTWGDFTSSALWRQTQDPPGSPECSVWQKIPGYSKHRRLFDSASAFVFVLQVYFVCI